MSKQHTLAFPQTVPDSDGKSQTHHFGMTLRDYFAAKAMQGLVSATTKMNFTDGQFIVDVMDETHMTKIAYSHADAMLKARES